MHKLKDKLYDKLEKLEKVETLSNADIEMAHVVTDTIKNIDKICMLEDDGGEYSQAGDWNAMGRMGGTYGGGNSYARGRYSRADRRRDSRGRYSREGGYSYGDGMDEIMDKLGELSESEKKEVKRFIEKM